MLYHVDLFTSHPTKWMKDYPFSAVHGPYGVYFTAAVSEIEKKTIIKKAFWSHIRYRVYEDRYARSENYRSNFFWHTAGPYRCAYCGKYLKKDYMVIDHIIPVNKAKTSAKARRLLRFLKIENVNDLRNLAPSCAQCNKKKSDKMGFWIIRGFWGKKHYAVK